MADLKSDVENTEEIELDAETLARLDRRMEEARHGRWYTPEEVRAMIPQWISKYATQRPR